ncbi:MAG: hypothetical protein P1U53_10410 [Sulfitobacter sp.]|nr:hypothetical protein [Sulfitobacter sp.]
MTDTPPMPAALADLIATWPAPAQGMARACRALFLSRAEARDIGPLEESLKWGQPAWRPVKPRTGSTLRLMWLEAQPDRLSLYVDCKTDIAARMRSLYPDLPFNDGQRRIDLDLTKALPEQAVAHLADMTLCYHLARREARRVG